MAIERARAVGGALLAWQASDTLKQVAKGLVTCTLERTLIWHAQTPQAMQRTLLEQALALAAKDGFTGTDDVSLLEHAGFAVEIVPGSPHNLKITTREELAIAEAIAALEDRTP